MQNPNLPGVSQQFRLSGQANRMPGLKPRIDDATPLVSYFSPATQLVSSTDQLRKSRRANRLEASQLLSAFQTE